MPPSSARVLALPPMPVAPMTVSMPVVVLMEVRLPLMVRVRSVPAVPGTRPAPASERPEPMAWKLPVARLTVPNC